MPGDMSPTVTPNYAPQVPPIPERFAEYQQPRQPAERQSALGDQQTDPFKSVGVAGDDIRPLLEALLSKLDSLADRPIDVTVTTQLDGRRIAEAVYKDLREQRIRNYETL